MAEGELDVDSLISRLLEGSVAIQGDEYKYKYRPMISEPIPDTSIGIGASLLLRSIG